MDIRIFTKNTTITPSIEAAAKATLKKALSIHECVKANITVEKTNEKEKRKAFKLTGIIYTKSSSEIVVSRHGEDVYKTFHILSDDLARHVRKAKEKQLRQRVDIKSFV